MKEMVGARVPPELSEALKAEAKRRGVPVSALVVLALERYFDGRDREVGANQVEMVLRQIYQVLEDIRHILKGGRCDGRCGQRQGTD
ncbi:MAG: hypothetical protein HPY89_00685 [Pelotomaculum sp.]|nr:hypothetical protein [Pelotomaculum sp.]